MQICAFIKVQIERVMMGGKSTFQCFCVLSQKYCIALRTLTEIIWEEHLCAKFLVITIFCVCVILKLYARV